MPGKIIVKPENIKRGDGIAYKHVLMPACFDSSSQWEEWKQHARQTNLNPACYCNDCTPQYQKSMVNAKRCDHPETFFVISQTTVDGEKMSELVGLPDWHEQIGKVAHEDSFYRYLRRGSVVNTK